MQALPDTNNNSQRYPRVINCLSIYPDCHANLPGDNARNANFKTVCTPTLPPLSEWVVNLVGNSTPEPLVIRTKSVNQKLISQKKKVFPKNLQKLLK
jgi:hypothetical protein